MQIETRQCKEGLWSRVDYTIGYRDDAWGSSIRIRESEDAEYHWVALGEIWEYIVERREAVIRAVTTTTKEPDTVTQEGGE